MLYREIHSRPGSLNPVWRSRRSLLAFSLIELLTVIAVICVVAAILFPVYAKAKEAAKATTSIANYKQILAAYGLYAADSDDVGVPRANQRGHFIGGDLDSSHPWGWISWKQNLVDYAKSTVVFADPANPAARFPDMYSDPAWVVLTGDTAIVSPHRMVRGYAMINSNFTYWTNSPSAEPVSAGVQAGNPNFGTPNVVVTDPSAIGLIGESKDIASDFCPCVPWSMSASEGNPSEPDKGLGPNWGGGKWGDRAFVAGYFDGHVKRMANGGSCGSPGRINFWGYDPGSAEFAANSWWGAFCESLPSGYQ